MSVLRKIVDEKDARRCNRPSLDARSCKQGASDRGKLAGVKRHPRAFWERLVDEVEKGASIVDVATRHRVRDTTLRWWRTQLRAGVRRAAEVRLIAVSTTDVASSAGHVEIACGGVVLRVETGTDVSYVAALARALGTTC